MSLKELTEKDVEFEIEALPEDIEVKGNASAISEEIDKQTEDEIYRQLDMGNIWAWCTVKVTAKFGKFEGVDYLGCCNYANEKDFKQDGYWEDMKQRALEDLNNELSQAYKTIKTLIKQEV